MPNPRQRLAQWGEDLVADYFTSRGFVVIARNFRRRGCELDLIVGRDRQLIILEVKTRRGPVEDVQALAPPRKLQALARGTQIFLQEQPEFAELTVHLGLAVISGKGTPKQCLQWQRLPLWGATED